MGNIWTVVIFFVITASIGLAMYVLYVLPGKNRPMPLAAIHGMFAFISISMLTYFISTQVGATNNTLNTAYLFFAIAAAGGIGMFVRDKFMKLPLPKWVPLLHAGAAITGFALLVVFAFSQM